MSLFSMSFLRKQESNYPTGIDSASTCLAADRVRNDNPCTLSYFTAIVSISTKAPKGNLTTPYAALAGGFSL